jgi:transcriptional regulator with XRE-family HTH domain
MNLVKFDADLRRWLKAEKTPIVKIAAESGVTVSWLQKYRNGTIKNPTLRNLVALWNYANK